MYPDWHGTVNYIRVLPFHLPAKAFTQVLHRPAWEFRREPHPAAKAGGHAGRLPADAANRSHPTCGRQRHDGLAKPRPNRGTLSFNGSRTAAAWEAGGPAGVLDATSVAALAPPWNWTGDLSSTCGGDVELFSGCSGDGKAPSLADFERGSGAGAITVTSGLRGGYPW